MPRGVSEAMLVARVYSVEVGVARHADADPARLADRHTTTVVELERAHGQVLFGFVRRLGVSDSAASDVVQESLLRLFRQLVDGAAIADPKAWTFHTAYRLAMDEHRRFARVTRLVSRLPGWRTTTSDDPALGPERELVWAEVNRLPQRQRAVPYLRFRGDLDFDAIGHTMGITASAARSHCTQALATLRTATRRGADVMDERRLESILRDGPPDEPAYRGDIAARLRAERDADEPGGSLIALVPAAPHGSPRRWRGLLPAAAAGIVVLLAAGLVLTLDDDEPRMTTPEVRDPSVLVDRWVGPPSDDGTMAAFVDFRAGGEFVYVTGRSTQPTRWGSTWSVDDDGLLAFVLNSEEQQCRIGAVGHYRWTGPHDTSTLTLSVVDDECPLRAGELEGTWTHTACPVGGSDCLGPVDAGTYASVTFDPFGTNRYGQVSYILPSGWAVTADSRAQLSLQPVDDDAQVRIDLWADVAVATAGCDGAPDTAAIGAAAVGDALADHEGLAARRTQTTIDGRDARVVDAEVVAGWSQVCPDEGDEAFVALLASRTGVPVSWAVGVSAEEQVRVILVDVANGRTTAIVVRGAFDNAGSIIESFRFADGADSP